MNNIKKACHPMMTTVWLLNALENALHEPNCLIKELIHEEVFDPFLSPQLTSDELFYAEQALENLHERLNLTRDLLSRFDANILRFELKYSNRSQ
jgi:hypothetical protein